MLFYRVKANNSNLKVDLYVNGELLDQNDDRKLISQVPIRDKTVSLHYHSGYDLARSYPSSTIWEILMSCCQ